MISPTRKSKETRSGSTLVVTLLVVSLLLVRTLAFSVWVRSEGRQMAMRQAQRVARANARLGLQLALARLQETAGVDQRVTFRGELSGAAQPAWCAVGTSSPRGSDIELDQSGRFVMPRTPRPGPVWRPWCSGCRPMWMTPTSFGSAMRT